MRAIVCDGRLRYVRDYPRPEAKPGWARIRVLKAGICTTDIEITRGYGGFKGVLGHEFVGVVDSTTQQDNVHNWTGRRVVGEINVGCGECDQCRNGLKRHCRHRKALGIHDLDGCMADYCMLPESNLHEVPESIPDSIAVLIEPLSAACEILDQIQLAGSEQAVVLGDGRLGILCAWALRTSIRDVTLVGHHRDKLEKAAWRGLKTQLKSPAAMKGSADIVVEATGSPSGLAEAIALCRPRGIIVIKTTMAFDSRANLSNVVVNEQTLIGSRCGPFSMGLRLLASHPDMPVERLISAEYPIEQALTAFKRAAQPDAIKVLIDLTGKNEGGG